MDVPRWDGSHTQQMQNGCELPTIHYVHIVNYNVYLMYIVNYLFFFNIVGNTEEMKPTKSGGFFISGCIQKLQKKTCRRNTSLYSWVCTSVDLMRISAFL